MGSHVYRDTAGYYDTLRLRVFTIFDVAFCSLFDGFPAKAVA
jgi:hypothetical protein